MESCIAMRMIIKESDVFCLILKDERLPHPLFNLEVTIVQRCENWNFPTGDQPEPLNVEKGARGLSSFPSHPTSTTSPSDTFSCIYRSISTIFAELH